MSFQTSCADARCALGAMSWRDAFAARRVGRGQRGGYFPVEADGVCDHRAAAQDDPARARRSEAEALQFARDAGLREGSTQRPQTGAGFGSGTMVMTQDGEVPVEWLAMGDRVLTLDHGFQRILWIGRRVLNAEHVAHNAGGRPVCIPAGSLSGASPAHDLMVMADHRVLFASPWAELYHLSSEVLVPAAVWAQAEGRCARQADFTVTQLLFARHEIICAQGAWVESMCLTEEAQAALAPAELDRLLAALGPDARPQETARPCVTQREAGLLVKAVGKSAKLPERNRV